MATVREIAEFAGVSKSTVSLVLNGKSGVSEKMRRTVLTARDELESLQSLEAEPRNQNIITSQDRKSQLLSMMVLHPPILRSSYVFSAVLRGIQSAAEMYNIQLRLVVNDPFASAQHVSHLYLTDDYLRPDGAIVFGAKQHEPLLEKIVERNIPSVVLGRKISEYSVSGIERDEAHYAYQLTQHLINLGHRSIAFVGGDLVYDYTHTRIDGYSAALKDAHTAVNDSLIITGNGAEGTRTALEQNPELTAIIYCNDSYAEEGIVILRDQNLSIPDDISVASFDNTEFACTNTPPLTSIAYNHFQEGQWAVKMLLDHVRFSFVEKSQMTFAGDLIVRDSTDAPKH